MNIKEGDLVQVILETEAAFTATVTHVPQNPGELWEVVTQHGTVRLINVNNPNFREIIKRPQKSGE